MILTRTLSQSGLDSLRYGLPFIFAVIGLTCIRISFCTSGMCGNLHA